MLFLILWGVFFYNKPQQRSSRINPLPIHQGELAFIVLNRDLPAAKDEVRPIPPPPPAVKLILSGRGPQQGAREGCAHPLGRRLHRAALRGQLDRRVRLYDPFRLHARLTCLI